MEKERHDTASPVDPRYARVPRAHKRQNAAPVCANAVDTKIFKYTYYTAVSGDTGFTGPIHMEQMILDREESSRYREDTTALTPSSVEQHRCMYMNLNIA